MSEASPQHNAAEPEETLPASESQVAASLGGTPLEKPSSEGGGSPSPLSPAPSASAISTKDEAPLVHFVHCSVQFSLRCVIAQNIYINWQ